MTTETDKLAQEREAFEKWAQSTLVYPLEREEGAPHVYECASTQAAWNGWKAHASAQPAQPASEVRVDCPLVGFVDREFSKSPADFGEICKVQDKRFAIPVYREMPQVPLASWADEAMELLRVFQTWIGPRQPDKNDDNRELWDRVDAVLAAPQPPSAMAQESGE